MIRTVFAALILAATTALVGCQDSDALLPSSPSGAIDPAADDAELCELAGLIFDGGKLTAVCKQLRNIERQAQRGQSVDAAEKAFDLIDFALDHFAGGRLNDPPGPDTTEDVLGALIAGIAELGGLLPAGSDAIPPGAFTEEGAFEMCRASEGCTVTTGTAFAGATIPAGTPLFDKNTGQPVDDVFVVINRESDTLFPFSPFGFDDFPLFYGITTIPEVVVGNNGALSGAQENEIVVGVCVVDPPDPLAPPEGADLRIARRFDGEEGDEVEVLPLRDASFLDCTGASTNGGEANAGLRGWLATIFGGPVSILEPSLLYANPGRLGGSVSAFSTFGAVDISAPEPSGTIRVSGFDSPRNRSPLTSTTPLLGASTLAAALADESNFGSDAVVACEVDVQPLVQTIVAGSLVDGQGSRQVDVFFAGLTAQSLTAAEATELADFLNAGGVVFISGNSNPTEGPSYNPLFSELDVADQYTANTTAGGTTSIPVPTPITNGPFGIVGPLSSTVFRILDTSASTDVASVGELPIVAELAVGDGYLSWMGDPLYFDLFTDGDIDNLNYFLNLFALGCDAGEEPQ